MWASVVEQLLRLPVTMTSIVCAGFFAPSEGIDEDAATGSIQCTLVPYWAGRTGKQTLRAATQFSRLPNVVHVVGDRVKIAGEVKLYLQGTINI